MSDDIFSTSNHRHMSEDIRAIASALIKAKKNFRSPSKMGFSTQFKKKYARLNDIYTMVEEALGNEGITIVHFASFYSHPSVESRELLYTRLVHAPTGQFIEDERILENEKPGNQARGSANTYMKRYAVLGLCGIEMDADDDGQEEQEHIDSAVITDTQISEVQALIKTCANGAKLYQDILRFNKIKTLNELKSAQFNLVRNYINKNKE